MKTTVKIISLMLTVAFFALLAVSCGTSIVGKWESEAVESAGASAKYAFEFKDDGKFSLIISATIAGITTDAPAVTGEYKSSSGKLTLNGAEFDCKVSGNTMEFTYGGVALKLTKK